MGGYGPGVCAPVRLSRTAGRLAGGGQPGRACVPRRSQTGCRRVAASRRQRSHPVVCRWWVDVGARLRTGRSCRCCHGAGVDAGRNIRRWRPLLVAVINQPRRRVTPSPCSLSRQRSRLAPVPPRPTTARASSGASGVLRDGRHWLCSPSRSSTTMTWPLALRSNLEDQRRPRRTARPRSRRTAPGQAPLEFANHADLCAASSRGGTSFGVPVRCQCAEGAATCRRALDAARDKRSHIRVTLARCAA